MRYWTIAITASLLGAVPGNALAVPVLAKISTDQAQARAATDPSALPSPEDCALLLIGLGCFGIAMRSSPAPRRRD